MNTQLQENFVDSRDAGAIQYLTFRLDGEAFATQISKVREVLEYTKVTRVPRTPGFMRGVINLRGSVVPVIDLRMQFGMPAAKRTVDTCIIILEVNIDEKLTVIGALADSVQEVIELQAEQLSDAPALGTRIDNQFISVMGKLDDGFVMILDLDVIFTLDPALFSNFTHDYNEVESAEFDNEITETKKLEMAAQTVMQTTLNNEEEQGLDSAVGKTPEINIDLDSAIQKHAQWKLKLHTAIKREENLAATEISRDDCCVLGSWLHGEAKLVYSNLDEYHHCLKKHKSFHLEAGRVAQCINDKKFSEAEAMLANGSLYAKASNDVASAIVALRKQMNH